MKSLGAAYAVQVIGTVVGLVGMFLVLATAPNGGLNSDTLSVARAVWSAVVLAAGIIGIPLAYLIRMIYQDRHNPFSERYKDQ